ncbi:oligosaccharide flippase family protein [Patescibacteria group bacterium]
MGTLGKWQIISFISRSSAMAVGLLQTFVILRILNVPEWGIVQLAVSLGESLGIYQHLGLASASNREISTAKKGTDVIKIFITTVLIRYCITIPLGIGLYMLAPKIASVYGFQEILLPLKIYAGVIIVQGMQAMLNSMIAGTKRFKELFTFQIVIAAISVPIYILFVYYFKVVGFFYALIIHESLKSLSLFFIALRPYFKKITFPTRNEFKIIFKELFSLGMSIYIVKILLKYWEKSGPNLIGLLGDANMLGLYTFAMLYGKKLIHVSDSITDVNLPVFSEKYVHDRKNFNQAFMRNFNKIFSFIVFIAFSATFWAPELISILVGGDKYAGAYHLLMPLVFAFVFFSLINIVKSSVIIPAKLKLEMIFGFILLLVSTISIYFVGKSFFSPLDSMAYGMLFGGLLSFVFFVYIIKDRLNLAFFKYPHVLVFVQAVAISLSCTNGILPLKIGSYIVLSALYAWTAVLAKLVSMEDVRLVLSMVKRKK